MDARRKSTMQPSADPYGNVRSNLPMPTTIKKPTPNSRMSLAGTAGRAPYPVPPSTNPRQSILRSQTLNPLLMSASKPNFGRTPLNNSVRRGSIWAGGLATQPSSSQTVAKDTRPLRDRQYQSKMRQDILQFLLDAGFDISMSTLLNIQGKDYRSIFEVLVCILDPCYPFNQSARFEDEFVPALKVLKYPFAHQIDNKWLAAPASMHSWPALLGVLHWLVELCKMHSDYLCSGHPTLQNPSEIPDEFDDPHDHKGLAFQYYEDAYTAWLDMADEFTEPNQVLESRYAKKNEQVQAELEERTNQLNQAKAEYSKLKSSAAPINKLQDENGLLIADSEKFQKILQQYEGRKKKLVDFITYERAELVNGDKYLDNLKKEREELSETVKKQNLSPEEVERMNKDHETLSRNLEDLKQKIADTHKVVMSLEVNFTNRAMAVDEALDTYNNLIASLELFPPFPPPWQNVDLTQELNTATSNSQGLLAGADIRKIIRPTLSSIAELKRSERDAVENERIKVDNELDQLTLECENVEEEIIDVEKKVAGLNEQADDLRDVAQQEALVASAEAERLERDLMQARNAALANGMGVKTRLQALQFDYREQLEKVSRLKEETVRAIIKNSHEIAMFKEEVSRHLRELRDFAEVD